MLDQPAPSLAHQVAAFAAAVRCDAQAAAARDGLLAALETCVLAAIAALLARLQAMVEDWEAGRLAIATPTSRAPGTRRSITARAAHPSAAHPAAPHAGNPTRHPARPPCAPQAPVARAHGHDAPPPRRPIPPARPAPHTARAPNAHGSARHPNARLLPASHAHHPGRSPKTTRPTNVRRHAQNVAISQ